MQAKSRLEFVAEDHVIKVLPVAERETNKDFNFLIPFEDVRGLGVVTCIMALLFCTILDLIL